MDAVIVTKRGADRIRRGHLWIYRSDLVETHEASGGSIVRVQDEHRNFIGQAFYSDSSQIALRFLTTSDKAIDSDWWRTRIREAAARRFVSQETNAYRVIYSEGDLLPSVIVDRYGDVLVLQTLSQGSEAIKPVLVELLTEEFKPRAIIERNDVRVRQHEGLELLTGTLFGEAPEEFEILQDGVRFLVAPLSGQKTGSFLDQRENRLAARKVAHGRALDCFTFNGAFALQLAGACDSVIGIDISADAIAAGERNAQINNIT
ncbi:MAG: class I SAM-dependent rRNA methyltransferase, partial [Pyrinomonadaceae bacterium]